jgi:hypothetical protein
MANTSARGRLAPSGGLAAFFSLFVVLLVSAGGHPVIALIVAVIGAALTYWYLYHVDEARKKWVPEEWQWRIEVRHSEVRTGEIDRIRRYFTEDETEILWVSHRHVIFLISRIWLPCLLAVGWLFLTAALGNVRIHLPQTGKAGNAIRHVITTKTANGHHARPAPQARIHIKQPGSIHLPRSLTIPWWIIIVPEFLFVLAALLIWAAWSSWFFVLTNRRVIVLNRPYPILPFMNGQDNPFLWAFIKNAEVYGSVFRRRWGLAVIDISTYLQPPEDDAIKGLTGIPHPDEVAELINKLVPERGSLDDDSAELQKSVQELTVVIRELPGRLGIEKPREEWPT